jgi:DNA-binding NarL/FixJ family response regulator
VATVSGVLTGAAPAQGAKPLVPVELPDGLTAREAEVLELLAAGFSNSEIARELFISEHTVKTHIDHVFANTRSRDRRPSDPLRARTPAHVGNRPVSPAGRADPARSVVPDS